MKQATKIGVLGLLFSVTNMNGVEATQAASMAAVSSKVEALSASVHQALMEQGAEAFSESEIRASIQEHLASYLENTSEETANVRPSEGDFVQLEVSIGILSSISSCLSE